MIEFKCITTSDIEYYGFMENLLKTAFPKEEYRELNELKSRAEGRREGKEGGKGKEAKINWQEFSIVRRRQD